jgi:transposase-like protein
MIFITRSLGQNSHTMKTLSSMNFFFDYMKERGLNRRQVNNFLHAKKDTESSLRSFLGLIWQTCYLHLIRKVIRKVP